MAKFWGFQLCGTPDRCIKEGELVDTDISVTVVTETRSFLFLANHVRVWAPYITKDGLPHPATVGKRVNTSRTLALNHKMKSQRTHLSKHYVSFGSDLGLIPRVSNRGESRETLTIFGLWFYICMRPYLVMCHIPFEWEFSSIHLLFWNSMDIELLEHDKIWNYYKIPTCFFSGFFFFFVVVQIDLF